MSVYKTDAATGERLGVLGSATGGGGSRRDLTEPIIVRASEASLAVPAPEG